MSSGLYAFCRTHLFSGMAFLLCLLWQPIMAVAGGSDAASLSRYLAGLPVTAPGQLHDLTSGEIWQDHSRRLSEAWAGFDRRQLSKLRTFAANQLTDPQQTALYFFSGPDFVYAQTLFPNAKTYVLAGLESADTFPEAKASELNESSLSRVRTSFENFFDFGVFVTDNMRGARFAGIPELLAVQVALTGNTIDNVSFVGIDAGGHESSSSPTGAVAHGIRITFHTAAGVSKQLYYISADLSDAAAPTAFLEFCRNLGPSDVLLKNAAFLLHKDSFSVVRQFLLANSVAVVQDDSGIPIRFFDPADWSLRLFGVYRPPPDSFSQYGQSDLSELEKKQPPESIDFPAGYYWWIRGSHLEIAIHKSRAKTLTR